MRSELKNFLYELGNYANHTHILKDAYEKLSDSEKALVAENSPNDQVSPIAQDKLAFEWLSTIQTGIEEKNQ